VPATRIELEAGLAADVRALSAESDQIGLRFAAQHQVSASDFRALLYVMVAETAGTPLTNGELKQRMGLSAAAITYLVERMIASGHFRRDSDPADRRKVILRCAEDGMAVARDFFMPLAAHNHRAMADLTDDELAAGRRVLGAMIESMRAFQTDLGGVP